MKNERLNQAAQTDFNVQGQGTSANDRALIEEMQFEWDVVVTGGPEVFAANPNWETPEANN